MAANLDALLHLTQALEANHPAAKLRLDLVTRNAQPAGNNLEPTAVAQAPRRRDSDAGRSQQWWNEGLGYPLG